MPRGFRKRTDIPGSNWEETSGPSLPIVHVADPVPGATYQLIAASDDVTEVTVPLGDTAPTVTAQITRSDRLVTVRAFFPIVTPAPEFSIVMTNNSAPVTPVPVTATLGAQLEWQYSVPSSTGSSIIVATVNAVNGVLPDGTSGAISITVPADTVAQFAFVTEPDGTISFVDDNTESGDLTLTITDATPAAYEGADTFAPTLLDTGPVILFPGTIAMDGGAAVSVGNTARLTVPPFVSWSSGNTPPGMTYQWQADLGNGYVDVGAPGQSFVIQQGMGGGSLRLAITAIDPLGQRTVFSNVLTIAGVPSGTASFDAVSGDTAGIHMEITGIPISLTANTAGFIWEIE